jgi:hypothetical protein
MLVETLVEMLVETLEALLRLETAYKLHENPHVVKSAANRQIARRLSTAETGTGEPTPKRLTASG